MNPHHSPTDVSRVLKNEHYQAWGGAIFFICRSLNYIMNLPKQWTLLFLFPVLVNIDLFRQMVASKQFNLELPRVQRSVNLIKIRTRQEASKKNSLKKIIEKQKRWNLEPSGKANRDKTDIISWSCGLSSASGMWLTVPDKCFMSRFSRSLARLACHASTADTLVSSSIIIYQISGLWNVRFPLSLPLPKYVFPDHNKLSLIRWMAID